MTLGDLVQVLQAQLARSGPETPVVVSMWHDQKPGYALLTHVDPPEVDGDAVTLAADPLPAFLGRP